MTDCIIKLDEWEKNENVYTYPKCEDGWSNIGLIPANKNSADVFEYFGFEFDCEIHGNEEITVKVGLLDCVEVNTSEIIDYFSWSGTVYGEGEVRLRIPLNQFDLRTSMKSRWRFLKSVEINKNVKNLKAIKSVKVAAFCRISSIPTEDGDVAIYKINISSCYEKKQSITIMQEKINREILEVVIPENGFVLAPYETKCIDVRVRMSDKIVPGGFEKQIIHVISDCDGQNSEKIELFTVRSLTHPFITHDDLGWKKVMEKINTYSWAKKLFQKYKASADEWEVPEIGNHNGGLFVTKNSERCYEAAFMWYLTKKKEYANKAALFLRRLSDPQNGYPKRRKASSQQLVHEGEFFKYCSRAYDLIFNSNVLMVGDHINIQNTFRLFIEFLDIALLDGKVSNWSLAENAGALYCSMVLQDRSKIERFTYGMGGIIDHLSAGTLSDGFWCECTIGYGLMVAGLFSECAMALRPWGINIANQWVAPNYSGKVHFAEKHIDGLSWDICGGNNRNYRCIEDLWDSIAKLADYRSVVFGMNDSAEEKLEGASNACFDSRYDIAYALYKKPEYAKIILNGGDDTFRCLFYGEGVLPDVDNDICHASSFFDNAGIALLRTDVQGRKPCEQIETTIKYGSHGGAHGHYDKCAINSLSRNGRALFNPENVWYSYGTFMYKFYVQTSIAHNMVCVDQKMQSPNECTRTMFYDGELFRAVSVETNSEWSNPPYGGWRVFDDEKTLSDRSMREGRYIPVPEYAPEYASRSGFTEKVLQRRCMVLTDDFVVCFDYMQGDDVHSYDAIYHFKGLRQITGDAKCVGHKEQLSENPLSSAQFITDVCEYSTNGTLKLSFCHEYTKEESGKAPWIGGHPFRTGHNKLGCEYVDLYYVEDGKCDLSIGRDPEYYPVSKRLKYSVEADGNVVAKGEFGAWILGREHIDVDIKGKKELKLHVLTEDGMVDHALVAKAMQTIFWGDPHIVCSDTSVKYLADISYKTENVDLGNGVGADYYGGKVKIVSKQYDHAVPGDTIDKSREAVITVDLSGLNGERFVSDIGGDYPLGDDKDARRYVGLAKRGREARFISICEPYEDNSVIKSVKRLGDDSVLVKKKDGTAIEITAVKMENGKIKVSAAEYLGTKLLKLEKSDE